MLLYEEQAPKKWNLANVNLVMKYDREKAFNQCKAEEG